MLNNLKSPPQVLIFCVFSVAIALISLSTIPRSYAIISISPGDHVAIARVIRDDDEYYAIVNPHSLSSLRLKLLGDQVKKIKLGRNPVFKLKLKVLKKIQGSTGEAILVSSSPEDRPGLPEVQDNFQEAPIPLQYTESHESE